jgi:glycosyltransferase involved in cell wall biosynthesis
MNTTLNHPTLSIAMATYNGELYIREQLESLAAQTVLPLELVVTDDGSTDKTVDIVEDFAVDAPFSVKVFRNEFRLGFADNFLKAAELCIGDWIAFCDQDDIWDRQKVEMVCKSAHNPELTLISHNYVIINAKGERIKRVRYAAVNTSYEEKAYWSGFLGFTISFRRSCLEKYLAIVRAQKDGLSITLPHDNIVSIIGMLAGKVFVLDQDLVCYRRHGSNTSGYEIAFDSFSRLDRLSGSYQELRKRYFLLRQINRALPKEEQLNSDLILRTANFLRRRILLGNSNSGIGRRLLCLASNVAIGMYSSNWRIGLGKRSLAVDILSVFGWQETLRLLSANGILLLGRAFQERPGSSKNGVFHK